MAALPHRFYARDAATVARALLGAILVAEADGARRRARITETEAYVGPHDKASHSRHGPTRRNASMFGPPGHAYVYFLYGMHHCLNVVTGLEGDGQAVLLRAAEPLDGWDARLTGPALLARAFRVTRADDGADLATGRLRLERGPTPRRIRTGPRVGVAYAGPWARRHLRLEAEPRGTPAPGSTAKRHTARPR